MPLRNPFYFFLLLLFDVSFSNSVPTLGSPKVQILHEFPNGTWAENLVVRSNGHILVTTLFPDASVYQVDPYHPKTAPRLVAHIPSALGCSGIAELSPTTYAFIANNVTSSEISSAPNSSDVWRLTFAGSDPEAAASVSKIAHVPAGEFLNGIAPLPNEPSTILFADSGPGVLYALDTATTGAEARVVQDSTTMKITLPRTALGINGVRIAAGEGGRDNMLFFTNSNQQTLVSVPLAKDGSAAGEYVVQVNFSTFVDDFALAPGLFWRSSGREQEFAGAYVATDPGNSIVMVDAKGELKTVLGGGLQAIIAGVTSAQFAKGNAGEEGILYLTTNGGLAGVEDGGTVGGKVLRIELGSF